MSGLSSIDLAKPRRASSHRQSIAATEAFAAWASLPAAQDLIPELTLLRASLAFLVTAAVTLRGAEILLQIRAPQAADTT